MHLLLDVQLKTFNKLGLNAHSLFLKIVITWCKNFLKD